MHLEDFLFGAFIYLTAAVISVPIAMRIGLGSVLGYLLAGIVIGPAFLGLVGREGQDVMHFAEFGVIVMLFLVGLELQPSKLWELRKPILGLGGLQVIVTAAALGLLAFALAYEWRAALATGLILAMSSTAIVLQSLGERGLLKTSGGQSAFAVLLFQDVAVIPILALLPLLAVSAVQGEAGHGAGMIATLPAWARTLAVLAAVALIIAAGRFLMRPLFRLVASTGIREIFVAFALFIVVGITLLMQFVGLSAALGTFLAGVVLAESEYRHELEMDLDPFKGLLLAVFFISVGAGIDFSLIASQPGVIVSLVMGFILVKLAILYGLAKLFRMPRAVASLFSFSLAQGGEFAFVLISFAAGLGLLAASQASLLIAMVALSMAMAPLLMIADTRVLQPRFALVETAREPDVIDERGARVIIAGHGRFGMTVGRILLANGYRAAVLDHDAEQVDVLRQFGYKIFYGDASRVDLLEAAGAHEAKALVIAVDGREKITEIVEAAKRHFPHLEIFARAFDRTHAYELINAGVPHVYREVFSASADMGQDVLTALGKHPFEAFRSTRKFRAHDEDLMRRAAAIAGDRQKLIDLTRAARAEIENVLGKDRSEAGHEPDHAWAAPEAGADPRS
jgi:monovalent cation:proton antiporter-2 (CPA2) family protein